MDADNRNQPETVLLAVTSLLFVWTTLFTAVRCWAKSSQQLWSYFDAVFTCAFLACVAQCTTIFLAVAQYGFGTKGVDAVTSESRWPKALYASDILYIVSIGLSRCSTAFFLSSLTRDRRHSIIGIVIASLAGTWTVASISLVAVRGDLSQLRISLEPDFVRWIGVEASGLVVELACWVFAVTLVWTLNMPLHRRLKLILIFAMRLLLIPIIALRLQRLSPAFLHDTLDDLVMVHVFTQTAMHFALVSECLTCLRPFMQTFHEGLAPGNSNGYWGGISHTSNPGVSNASGAENELKKHMRVTASQIRDSEDASGGYKRRHKGHDGSMQLRSDRSGFSARCESKRDVDDGWTTAGDDDIELLSTNRSIHVRQTTVLSVSSNK